MLHHSNSRNQRNRGSRTKTLIQATLLLGVVFWLLYQVRHSYAKKNEYLEDTEDQFALDDRSMFQGRKEKAGTYSDNDVGKVGENSAVITKPEEGESNSHSDTSSEHNDEKSGDTVFDKDSTDPHEDDKRNNGSSEIEEGQVGSSDSSRDAHSNKNEDEKAGHSEEDKHDIESNSDAESKSEVHPSGDDVTQNNQAQEAKTGETDGTSHEGVAQGNESSNEDQINTSSGGSDGEGGDKKEEMDAQAGSESLPGDGHDAGSRPDETGKVPSVHTDELQNYSSEDQGNTASTASDSSENNITESVNIETGLEDVATTTSSETASDDDKRNSMESDTSDRATAEEKPRNASENSQEDSSGNSVESDEGSAMKEVANAQAANMETGNSQDSSGDAVTGSSEEVKPIDNQGDGATEMSNNGERVDIMIESITSTSDEHKESQGGDSSSGSHDSNGSHPEQTSVAESQ